VQRTLTAELLPMPGALIKYQGTDPLIFYITPAAFLMIRLI